MEYNQVITSGVVPLLDRIIRMVDRYSDYYKIKDVQISVDDSDLGDLGSYVSSGTTCEFRIDIYYLLEGEEDWRELFVTVPRMVNGIFIINGKYKMINRTLGEDTICRAYSDRFKFNGGFNYKYDTHLFGVYDVEDRVWYDFSFKELLENYPEYIKLTEHQGYKLKLKLNLDYVPTKITPELLEILPNAVETRNDIIDRRIISIDASLIKTLKDNLLDIVKKLNYNFYKTGTISAGPIQKIIKDVFTGMGDDTAQLLNSTNVNPLSFDSISEKILIDREDMARLSPGNYDVTMADIIDPVVTPDNANINRINYLTKAATMKDGYLAIKCYDNQFRPIEVNYVQYLASRVLISSEVTDYENKIIPQKSTYKIKYNRHIIESATFDYIEPSDDDCLCVESRMIPMLNLIDSVRGAMGAKMIGQAVPLSNPDTPRVQSGHESDTDASTTDIKFESTKPGEVIKADVNSVIVMVEGIPKEYKVPSPAVGMYDITAAFAPRVKVGDHVKLGDSLITHDIAKKGTKNLGLNALVALRPYRGYNYEDGIVISQSFANRLNHYSVIDLTLMVKDDESILSLLPVGVKVKAKDTLVHCTSQFRNETSESLIRVMTPEDKSISRSNNLVVPNTVSEGYITDVKIYYNDYTTEKYGKTINELGSSSIEVLENFKRKRAVVPDSVPIEYRAQMPNYYDYDGYAACIRYRILASNPATVGSKLANRYGSKGMVALVVPDDEMDRTEDGREIDVILNSDAVIARKNIAQIPEVFLSNIADRIKEKIIREGFTIDESKVLLAKYGLTQYSAMPNEKLKVVLASMEPLNYITGSFSKFTIEQILQWTKELGLGDGNTRIIDGKTKRSVKNPVLVGSMYMMKLYVLPEYTNKVYTSESNEDPILGKGLQREGEGQAQGALETYSLMASDLDEYIRRTRRTHQFQDAESLMINLRLAGVNLRIRDKED